MKTAELEIPATRVPAGTRANILIRPGSLATSPYCLLFNDEASQYFLVSDVWCGRDSVMVARGAVPARSFSDQAAQEEIYLGFVPADLDPGEVYDVFQIANDPRLSRAGLTIGVVNMSDVERTIFGRVLCRVETDEVMRSPSRFRTVLGLGCTMVPGRQACNVSVVPHLLFSPDRLVIPSDIGAHFRVLSVREIERPSGEISQIVAGSTRGEDYSEKIPANELLTSRAPIHPGSLLCVSVENRTDDPIPLSGAFFGEGAFE
jgi:hypothetical protein